MTIAPLKTRAPRAAPRTADLNRCTEAVLETSLLVTRLVRREVRSHRPLGLSLPQIRCLGYVSRHQACSPSDVTDYLGLSLASVSKLVDALVTRGLLVRRASTSDRRRRILTLTPRGAEQLVAAQAVARTLVARHLAPLSPDDRADVLRVMSLVRPLVALAADGLTEMEARQRQAG